MPRSQLINSAECKRHRAACKRHDQRKIALGLCRNCSNLATSGKLCWNHRLIQRKRKNQQRALYRQKVLDAYGRKCCCCRIRQAQFLTIDHVNNDGAAHKRKIGEGNIHWWIVKNNFSDTIRLLCWNCNSTRGVHGICPHENFKGFKDGLGI